MIKETSIPFRWLFVCAYLFVLCSSCSPAPTSQITPIAVGTTPAKLTDSTIQVDLTTVPETTGTPRGTVSGIQAELTPTQTGSAEPVSDTWIKIYGGSRENMIADMVQAGDGGFLTIGGIGKAAGKSQEGGILLMKTDQNGQVMWFRVYGGKEFDIGWTIIPTHDGNFLISGETNSIGAGGMDVYLIKVDPDGNEIWSHTYGGALDETVASVRETLDGGYILFGNCVDPEDFITDPGIAGYAGFAGRSNIYVVRIDHDGNEIWSRTLDSEENMIVSAGLAAPDGGFIVMASIISFPSLDYDLYLLKMDGNGEQVWQRTWQEDSYSGYTISQNSEQNYLISGVYKSDEITLGDIYLLIVDEQGNELMNTKYGDPNRFEAGHGIIETYDGNYLVLGSATDNLYSASSDILLLMSDHSGNLLWQKEISVLYHNKVNAFLALADGCYLIAGGASSISGFQNSFLIKTDGGGNVVNMMEMVTLK
ncbi:hypothetical protein ACFLZW_02645 [Chloroflexota bacterium]